MASSTDKILESCLDFCLQNKNTTYTFDDFKLTLRHTEPELLYNTLINANALFKFISANKIDIYITVIIIIILYLFTF